MPCKEVKKFVCKPANSYAVYILILFIFLKDIKSADDVWWHKTLKYFRKFGWKQFCESVKLDKTVFCYEDENHYWEKFHRNKHKVLKSKGIETGNYKWVCLTQTKTAPHIFQYLKFNFVERNLKIDSLM